MKPSPKPMVELITLILLVIVAVAAWNTPFLYPVKVFTVVLHEFGHGLATILTGGTIERIEISQQIGGMCVSRGGSMLFILPAGYLGSMVFGCLILIAAAKTNFDKAISFAIGVGLIALVILYIRSTFGIVFALGFGAALALAGLFAPRVVNDLILKFLGLTSALYAVIDIKEDLISRTVPGSDAYQMSQLVGLPPVIWGVLWSLVAVVVTLWAIRVSLPKVSATRALGSDAKASS